MASKYRVGAGDLVLIGRLDLPEPFVARVLWIDELDVLTEQSLPRGLRCRRLSTTASILAVGDLADLHAAKALWASAGSEPT